MIPDNIINKKSGVLMVITLIFWIILVVYMLWDVWSLVAGAAPPNIKIIFIIFSFLFSFFLLDVVIIFVSLFFSHFRKDKTCEILKNSKRKYVREKTPKVTLLYCTYNDFYERAVAACLNQNYENYHVYILDDSNDIEYKDKIDEFIRLNLGRASVIRRENRLGFKAGNLNNALRLINDQYEYFAVIDSDTLLPRNFIADTLPWFSINDKIAFVQANNKGYTKVNNSISSALALGIELHYRNFPATKNQYGLSVFYGHNAMIKTEVWKKINGFPEIVSEDIAFSLVVRSLGYCGIFVKELVCQESFPADYIELRRRSEKWTKGTLEFLLKFLPKFLKDKKIYWFEKLDIFLAAISCIFPFPYLFLLLVTGMSALFNYLIKIKVTHASYYPLISNTIKKLEINLLFFVMLTPCAVLILLLVSKDTDKNKIIKKAINYIVYQTYYFLANFIKITINIISFIMFGKVDFPVTGDRKRFSKDKNLIYSEDFIATLIEYIVVATFLYIGIAVKNNWLGLIGVSSLLNLYIFQRSEVGKIAVLFIYVIFFITVIVSSSYFF